MDRNLAHGHSLGVLVAALAIVLASPTPSAAGEESAGVAGDWLSRYTSARTMGLGGAFVATADEPLGAIWNPAGLSRMYRNQVHGETARLFEGTSINAVSFALPAETFPSLGLTILSLRSDDIPRTSELNEPLGTFHEGNTAFLFSAARNLSSRLSLGANLKVARQSIEDFDATGVGADLGVIYEVVPTVRVGASFLNLGGPGLTLRDTRESYAGEFRGGVAVETFSGKALLSLELDHRSGPGTTLHAGTEYWVHELMALRVGYYADQATGGVSFRPSSNLQVDYGLGDHELGVTHRIGVCYRFGGFFASSQAEPPVFSPIGRQSVTKFHLRARTKTEARRWRLEVVDKFDQTVRRFSGNGVPPAHLVWDGKDETGLPLPDGTYEYRLVVWDDHDREIQADPGTVEIATGGPRGAVPAEVG